MKRRIWFIGVALLVPVGMLFVAAQEKSGARSYFIALVKSDLPQIIWSRDGKFVRITQRFLLGQGNRTSQAVEWVFNASSRKRIHPTQKQCEALFSYPEGVYERNWRTGAVSIRLAGSSRWVRLQGVTSDGANPEHVGKWVLAGVGYAPDKSAVFLAWNQEVGTWSTRTGQLVRRVKFHPRGLESANCRMDNVGFSPLGSAFSASWKVFSPGWGLEGKQMQGVFDAQTGRQKFAVPPGQIVFSPRASVVSSLIRVEGGRGGQLEIRNATNGQVLWKAYTQDTFQFIQEKPLVVLRGQNDFEVRDENTGAIVRRVQAPQTSDSSWSVAPDGLQVWTWKNGNVLAWRLR